MEVNRDETIHLKLTLDEYKKLYGVFHKIIFFEIDIPNYTREDVGNIFSELKYIED